MIDTVSHICEEKIQTNPKLVQYPEKIENAISIIEKELESYKIIPSKLLRWISIKILDGDNKILKSIEEKFHISIVDNSNLNNIKNDLIKELKHYNNESLENFKDIIVSSIINTCEKVSKKVCTFENMTYSGKDKKIDKILTSKIFGFPLMILFLAIIFWITIVGANYPSEILFSFFSWLQENLIIFADIINTPSWLSDMLINGVYRTLTWIISVMLPPMAIFFPLFTFLEDLGYLPRLAFNVDGFFRKCSCSGKQMITMCMGFGCNSARCYWL